MISQRTTQYKLSIRCGSELRGATAYGQARHKPLSYPVRDHLPGYIPSWCTTPHGKPGSMSRGRAAFLGRQTYRSEPMR